MPLYLDSFSSIDIDASTTFDTNQLERTQSFYFNILVLLQPFFYYCKESLYEFLRFFGSNTMLFNKQFYQVLYVHFFIHSSKSPKV